MHKKVHLLLLVCGEYIALILFFSRKPAHMDNIQSHGKGKCSKENLIGKIHPEEYTKRKPQQISVLKSKKQ